MADARALRILFLTRSLGFGGAERQLVELAKALHQRGHAVTVAESYAPGPLTPELVAAGVRTRSLGKTGRWDLTGFTRSLVALVKDERPDVLHSYLVEPNILAAAVKARFPRLKVVWGIRASNMDFAKYGLVSRMSFATSALLSRVPDRIIANSHAGVTFHAEHGYPRAAMHVVPNGIDVGRFTPDPEARRAERATLGVDDGTLLIGVMGRLDVMKDHPTFLRAVALHAPPERLDVRYLVTGSGPAAYVAEMQRLAQELGVEDRVVWQGPRTDAQRVLNALDIMTSTSAFGEGFPNVVGEAMACGVPCVVTDVGDSGVVVGSTGIVVPPGAAEGVAEGWATLAGRLSPELSTACRSRIAEEFSVDRLAERTVAVLRDVVAC